MATNRNAKAVKFIFIIILTLIAVFMYMTYKSGKDAAFSLPDPLGKEKQLEKVLEFDRDFDQQMDYALYKDRILQYSRGGVRVFDMQKVLQWEQDYSINQPYMKVNGDFFCIANLGGTELYVFDHKGLVYQKKLDISIESMQVNSQGKVAVLGKKTDETEVVQVLDEKGNEIVRRIHEASTVMSMALSAEGKYLATAIVKTDGPKLKSAVVFFDIYNEGHNVYRNDNMIAASPEYNGVIFDIQFSKAGDLIVLGDHFAVMLDAKAKEKGKKDIHQKILAQDIQGQGIGALVTEEDAESASTYMLHVLRAGGMQVVSFPIDLTEEPRGIIAKKGEIFIYTNRKVYGISMNGQIRWQQNLFMDIEKVKSVENNGYLVVSRDKAILIR